MRLFQLFCETKSLAVCRAYGTLTSTSARAGQIAVAAEEFFGRRDIKSPAELEDLLKAYNYASSFRNKIAHGIVAGISETARPSNLLGYYLTAASYSSRQRERITQKEWWLSAKYFYTVQDVKNCQAHFDELLKESIGLGLRLNAQYKILASREFHP